MKNTDRGYFERFSFGDSPEMADELLALVLAGKKTATVSVILEDEKAPSVGDLSLVLDGRSTPACVIKTVHVEIGQYTLLDTGRCQARLYFYRSDTYYV